LTCVGTAPPATAKRQVFAAVSAVRRAVRATGHDPVTNTRGGYRLTATKDELDLLAFGHHRDQAQQFVRGANPFREQLAGCLMLALYRSGRPADALATYRRTRQILSAELGIEPSKAIAVLNDRILHNDGALRVPPAERQPRINASRRFLPRDIPDFTGRSAVLERLDALLATAPGGTDVVVVSAVVGVGVGGIGKTALAVHWTHRIASRFPDGQLYLNLRGYDDRRPLRPTEALDAVLRALGIPPERIPTDADEASALYRATLADQRVLIRLDNARSVEQVRPLLPSSPSTLVLVTSRDALGGLIARDGARRLNVDLLSLTDAVDLLARILGADRMAVDARATEDLVAACGYLPAGPTHRGS
jgi:hypothetical protein